MCCFRCKNVCFRTNHDGDSGVVEGHRVLVGNLVLVLLQVVVAAVSSSAGDASVSLSGVLRK